MITYVKFINHMFFQRTKVTCWKENMKKRRFETEKRDQENIRKRRILETEDTH